MKENPTHAFGIGRRGEEKEVLAFCAGEMLLTAMPHEDAVAC